MIALRKSSLWIGGLVAVIVLGGLALLILAQPAADISQQAQATTTPAASQAGAVFDPFTATPLPSVSARRTATPGVTATHTPTFIPPLPTELTFAPDDLAPTDLPPMTVITETQSGPGMSRSFVLDPGIYRVIFRAENGFDMVLPIVEIGDCGSEPLFFGQPGPFEGSSTYRSSGCTLHFEVDGAGGGWSLDVESIPAVVARTVPLTLQGDAPLTSDVVDLPEGSYLVAVDSQSEALVVAPLILDGECLERPILVLTAPGSYQKIYESAGCRVVFQISAANGSWTVVVTLQP